VISSTDVAASHHAVRWLEPFVELSFLIRGTSLPADHGYALFAALVQLVPEIRQQPDLSIHSIPGFGDKQGKILLTPQSCMRMRLPVPKIPLVYPLAGKRVQLGKHNIQIGIPQIYPLHPSETLRARIVTIKGYTEPDIFVTAAQRQLDQLSITGKVTIPNDQEGYSYRKTIKIQRFTVVGFTTEISGLSDEDSIRLQQSGIGGKKHMGCGFFLPVRKV
jgi:CRISPR-associated protein Cas6